MLRPSLLVFIVWALAGCGTTRSLRPDSPEAIFKQANDFLANRRATVELADGSRMQRVYASIAPDYIWIGPSHDLMQPHAWNTVLRVSTGRGFSGVFFGFVIGMLIPGIPLAALGASGCSGGGLECIGPTVGGAAGGLVVGGLLGSIVMGAGKDRFLLSSDQQSGLRIEWRPSAVVSRR